MARELGRAYEATLSAFLNTYVTNLTKVCCRVCGGRDREVLHGLCRGGGSTLGGGQKAGKEAVGTGAAANQRNFSMSQVCEAHKGQVVSVIGAVVDVKIFSTP